MTMHTMFSIFFITFPTFDTRNIYIYIQHFITAIVDEIRNKMTRVKNTTHIIISFEHADLEFPHIDKEM